MLKPVLVAAVLLSALATGVRAWDVKPGSDIVLFGGTSSASFSGGDKNLLGDGTRDGGLAGLAFVIRVNPDYGFEADVRLTQKGGEGEVDITDYTQANSGPTIVGEGTTSLAYVEIPLMFTAQLGVSRNSHLRAFGGPSFNVLVSANFEGTIEGQEQNVDIKEGISSFDYAIVLGGGWVYDAGKATVWIDGRWVSSLTSIDDTAAERDIKNQSWEVALGVGFPLARE